MVKNQSVWARRMTATSACGACVALGPHQCDPDDGGACLAPRFAGSASAFGLGTAGEKVTANPMEHHDTNDTVYGEIKAKERKN
jgi:hypothetical protein